MQLRGATYLHVDTVHDTVHMKTKLHNTFIHLCQNLIMKSSKWFTISNFEMKQFITEPL